MRRGNRRRCNACQRHFACNVRPHDGRRDRVGRASPYATTGPSGGFYLQGTAGCGGNLYVGDRRRASNGYPLHGFRANAACDLTLQPDAVFLPLPPVEVRAPG